MGSSRDEILFFTHQLVQIGSVVNTDGEKAIADALYAMMSAWPYFQAHPKQIAKEKTQDDPRDRANVMALVRGTKAASARTIILTGHLDTVGFEDYGRLREVACRPDELAEALRGEPLPESARMHLQSGGWVFGRGTLDMKCGVAVHMHLMNYYAEHPEDLEGNLLFLAVCDEEDSSHGMLSALDVLQAWRVEQGLEYIGAINGEFVSPAYAGDECRYIDKGTVGKLLPTAYIAGVESHVGSCFEGIDPNFIASELTRQINYNPELCDERFGESTMPPVTLKQADLKPFYTVQTPVSAFVYYNFFVHRWSPADVMELLREQAEVAMARALARYEERYEAYCRRVGEASRPLTWLPEVWTYAELHAHLLREHGEAYIHHMGEFKDELLYDDTLDIRMFSVRVVEEAWRWMKSNRPAIVWFYSSLYSPASTLTGGDERERRLNEAVDRAIERVQPAYAHPIKTRAFFPYISDMSFLRLMDDEAGIVAACENNPSWGSKHRIDYEAIRRLDIPVVNIGPYGMDAHHKHERFEIEYSTQVVPKLIDQVIRELIG